MVVFGIKWLYSRKKGCIREKVAVFGKEVVFWKKWLYSGISGCIRANW